MKKLIFLFVIVLLVGIAYLIYRYITFGTLKLTVVPNDAKVVIDGKRTDTKGKISLHSGVHTLVVQRDGFLTKTVKETIKAHTTSTDVIAMIANSQAGLDYLQQHPDQTSASEAQTYQNGIKQGQAIVKTDPIINDLPYDDPNGTYEINYGANINCDPNSVTIYIRAISQDAITNALEWIRQDGYDPSKLSIVSTTDLIH